MRESLSIHTPETLQHNCALFGMVSREPQNLSPYVLSGLTQLAHRGEEGIGLVVADGNRFYTNKQNGISNAPVGFNLPECRAAIGHTRYATSGDPEGIQPIVFDDFAIAHNGTVYPHTTHNPNRGDTYNFAKSIDKSSGPIESRIIRELESLEGAYSLLFTTPYGRLFVARDPAGVRPLLYTYDPEAGIAQVASETIALTPGAQQIPRGILAELTPDGLREIWTDPRTSRADSAPCTLEFSYFADAASEGSTDAESRKQNHLLRTELGRRLAQHAGLTYPNIDAVVPVPNSGWSYAEGFALESGIPLTQAIHVNRHRGRTFTNPAVRNGDRNPVLQKYHFIEELIRERNIVLVDDSLVRGTTMEQLIKVLFDTYGAEHIDLMLGIPPVTHPCHWGIDMPDPMELAYNKIGVVRVGGESFEEALVKMLSPNHHEQLSVTFQTLEDYQEVLSGDRGDGCYYCVSGDKPKGLYLPTPTVRR
jgi:amidophosphoribosyltransferase